MYYKVILVCVIYLILINISATKDMQETNLKARRILVRRIRKFQPENTSTKSAYAKFQNHTEKKDFESKIDSSSLNAKNFTSKMQYQKNDIEMLGSLYNKRRIEKMLQGKSGDL